MKAKAGSTILLLLLSLALPPAALAGATARAENLYSVRPAPAWAQARVPDYRATIDARRVSGGVYVLLYDRDYRVLARSEIFHLHMAVRLLSAAGIDEYSQLNFDVDPSYQTLALNYVRVVRDGKPLEQIGHARITQLAQEDELDRQLYNGGYTVNLLLDDLRAGDIVEYEYTLDSRSELFPEHFYAWFQTRWSNPVLAQRVRVLNESGRSLKHRNLHESLEATVRRAPDGEEFEWRWTTLPALASDSDMPSWYSAWPSIEISDLHDWKSVVDLLRPLYEAQVRGDGAPRERARSIEAQQREPEKRILAATHFVQDEIRYAGIEIGPGSHRPTDPEVVLKRRFGDCKDKTLLLVSMLRSMGYDAVPALVNTDDRQALFDRLPTPYAFDHVIALLRLKGSSYWIDGTMSHEHGALATFGYSDLKAALVLDAGSNALATIPTEPVDAARKLVTTTIDLRGGLDKPAKLDIASTYFGAFTSDIRQSFESTSRERTARAYLNYYAKHYPSVHTLRAPDMVDDTEANEVKVLERYRIDNPAEHSGKGETTVTVHADEIYPYVHLPDTRIRTSPIAVAYPASVTQTFDVLLPEEWNLDPSDVDIRNDIFHYHSSVRYEPKERRAVVRYDYQALNDTVPVAYVDQYYGDVNRMNDDLGYSFILTTGSESDADERAAPAGKTRSQSGPARPVQTGIAPVPVLITIAALGLGALLARRIYRYDPLPRDGDLPAGTPAGFGGWLTLPAIGLIINLGVLVYAAVDAGRVLDMNFWTTLGGNARALEGKAYFLISLVLVVLQLAVGFTLAVLFARRRTSAPRVWLIFMTAVLAGESFILAEGVRLKLVDLQPHEIVTMARSLVVTVLWAAYMLTSKRVKATFVRRLLPPVSAGMQESVAPT